MIAQLTLVFILGWLAGLATAFYIGVRYQRQQKALRAKARDIVQAAQIEAAIIEATAAEWTQAKQSARVM